jgi:MFS family permease
MEQSAPTPDPSPLVNRERQFQISLIEWGLVLGYGFFQLPGGVFGQRHGARRTFVIIGLAAFLATIGMPLAPYILGGDRGRAAGRCSRCHL